MNIFDILIRELDLLVDYDEEDNLHLSLKKKEEGLKRWEIETLHSFLERYLNKERAYISLINNSEAIYETCKDGFFVPRDEYERRGKMDYDFPPGIFEFFDTNIGSRRPYYRAIGKPLMRESKGKGEKELRLFFTVPFKRRFKSMGFQDGITLKNFMGDYSITDKYPSFSECLYEVDYDFRQTEIVLGLTGTEEFQVEEENKSIHTYGEREFRRITQMERFLKELEMVFWFQKGKTTVLIGEEARKLYSEFYEKYGIENEIKCYYECFYSEERK